MDNTNTNNTTNTNSWDGFISNFIRAVDVKTENDAFVVTKVDHINLDGDNKIRLSIRGEGKDYTFDLNKTNAAKCKELGMLSPNALVSKKLYFKKALVRNPKTNLEVESLRIYKIDN